MKAIHITTMMAALLVAILLVPAMAQANTTAGMDKIQGDGWDFYGPVKTEVNSVALFQVINYGDTPITVTLSRQDNVSDTWSTLYSRGIAPHSSQFLQLTFPTQGRDYRVVISDSSGLQLHVATYTRPTYVVTFPADTWTPPEMEPEDPKVYTQLEWDDMVNSFWLLIAQMSMESVMFVSFATVGGIAAGVAVKSKTKFIAPTDPISTIIILAGCADFALQLSPIGMYWIPLLAGYVIAYLIYHIRWVGRGTIDYATQTVKIDPYVTYNTADGQPAIQEQTWRGAIARMLGHHHTLGTDGALVESWACEFKKPWMPRLTSGLIWVEKEELDIKVEKWGPLRIKEKSSRWILADASTARKVDLLTKADVLSEQIEERRNDKMELTRLRAEKEAMTIKTSGQILRDIQSYSITSAIERLATAEPKQKLPDNDERLTATEKIETKVKEEEK